MAMGMNNNTNHGARDGGLRALIVEDSEDDALLLADHLRSADFQLEWLRVDTEPALREALADEWDIVFSDYSMPHFSGARALEIVKRYDPDIPFIFVSGTIGEETAVHGMRAGAQDYVMKGNLARLLPAVERELAEAKVRRERRHTDQLVRRLSQAVEQAADSVFITDRQGTIEYVNPSFERLTGYSAAEAIGTTPALLKSEHHDDAFFRKLWNTILAGRIFQETLVNRRKDGGLFYEEKTIAPLFDEGRGVASFVSTGRDVTDRIRDEQTRGQLLEILEATTDFVAIIEGDGRLRYLNRAGRAVLGLTASEDVSGRHIAQCHPEWATQRLLTEAFPTARRDGAWQGEITVRLADGREIPVSQVVLAHGGTGEMPEFFSTIARDITERKHFEQELRRQATHDALTGLPNRILLEDQIEVVVAHSARSHKLASVLFLDIDNFKRINDSLGHAAGDELLREVSRRLRDAVRPTDLPARLGGDEFAVVMEDVRREEDAFNTAERVLMALSRPIELADRVVTVRSSIGVALSSGTGWTTDELLRNADVAMYIAKSDGKGRVRLFESSMHDALVSRLELEADLDQAVERAELVLHYQPIVDLATGDIIGFEGLVRWDHPERGLLMPLEFIPFAEETGQILPIDRWVLLQACCQTRQWQLEHPSARPLEISVNLSTRQLEDDRVVDLVRLALEVSGLAPECLVLEVTESFLLRDEVAGARRLRALRELGVRLAIDDFGTGYSSLSYLRSLPVDVLKIDRSFVGGLGTLEEDSSLVRAILSLANSLGLATVAEGVETEVQRATLVELGCAHGQGWHFSKAVDVTAAGAMLGRAQPVVQL